MTNRNLKEITGNNCLENGKVKGAKNTFTVGKYSPCLSWTGNLCCSQLTLKTTFTSQQTKRKFKMYYKVNFMPQNISKPSALFTKTSGFRNWKP